MSSFFNSSYIFSNKIPIKFYCNMDSLKIDNVDVKHLKFIYSLENYDYVDCPNYLTNPPKIEEN
jgi:hypothetical protein